MQTEEYENHNSKRQYGGSRPILLGLALLIIGSAFTAGIASGSASSLNNVQVFVTTGAQLQYSYYFNAYNLTGSLAASYQGNYPAAGFELPTGDYLFTVSAVHQSYCYMCAQPLNGGPVTPVAGSAGAYPALKYTPPAAEYGWTVSHIDSSTTLNIDTKNVTNFPTTNVSVKVSFVNGTAAAGAWVSAYVVGQWYYWWGQNSGVVMSAQTDNNGMATLVVPVAPAVVTAWDWVQVNLPTNQTTVTVIVGGQKVNVTVNWYPTYVGLSASTLLIPPASSASLTLTYQQPNYWYLPPGVGYAQAQTGQGGATIAQQPSGVPSQVSQARTASTQTGQQQMFLPSQIPALQKQGSSPASNLPAPSTIGMAWATAAIAVGAFAALGVALVVLGRRKSPSGAAV